MTITSPTRPREPRTPSTTMRESRVEGHLVNRCQRAGFLCLKFVSPGRGGVPDRVVITPVGTVFVEVKRPGEQLRRRQRAVSRKMRRHGAIVHVVSTLNEADQLVEDLTQDVETAS